MKLICTLLSLLSLIPLSACGGRCPEAPCALNNERVAHTKKPQLSPSTPLLEVRGGSYLEGLHPEFVRRVRLLYEQAESEGILLRLISGYRPYRPKRDPKPNKSVASWHNFGLAIDLNMQGRKGMPDALKHLQDDMSKWRRVGELARGLGLTWGYPWGKEEIFHFEWHPGWPDAIRAPVLTKLKQVTRGELRQDYREVWSQLK